MGPNQFEAAFDFFFQTPTYMVFQLLSLQILDLEQNLNDVIFSLVPVDSYIPNI